MRLIYFFCDGASKRQKNATFGSLRTVTSNATTMAKLINVLPEYFDNGDIVVTKKTLLPHLENEQYIDALIIKIIPNDDRKLYFNYSNTNPIIKNN